MTDAQAPLPPGVTIDPPPAHLRLREHDPLGYWRRTADADDETDRPPKLADAKAFPARIETGAPDALSAKPFACSGGVDSSRYMEAKLYRPMPDMTWPEARAALNRLLVPVTSYLRQDATTAHYVGLAEFALTAHGFTGFQGLKSDHAVKLRRELQEAIGHLCAWLSRKLSDAAYQSRTITRPVTNRLQGYSWRGNAALWAMVPVADDQWARINETPPAQAIAALDHLRAMHATWTVRRPEADRIADLLSKEKPADMPSAADYAEAVHIADMLDFTATKLSMLYAGIMHSIPFYRLHPATPEHEMIASFWPWGRPPPLIDGGPAKPPKPRKAVLDPAIITVAKPQHVVREVMEKTSIDRTTAQRLTAKLRAEMRSQRQEKAADLLRQGATKAEVARAIGLSPSRISAMFKGKMKPQEDPLRALEQASHVYRDALQRAGRHTDADMIKLPNDDPDDDLDSTWANL
jgi:hypothetical protein